MQLHPQHFEIEKILTTNSVRQKTSEARRRALEAHDLRCFNIVAGIIRDGVAAGDLELAGPEEASQLAFGLWSMAFGGHLLSTDPNFDLVNNQMGIRDPQAALTHNYDRFLDGYGWQPLSGEWDYAQTYERIRDEVFAAEWGARHD